MKAERPKIVTRTSEGRCLRCSATWSGPGAQGQAALHYDTTGHPTEARVVMVVRYGAPKPAAPAVSSPARRRRGIQAGSRRSR